jgi:hypothetical protein
LVGSRVACRLFKLKENVMANALETIKWYTCTEFEEYASTEEFREKQGTPDKYTIDENGKSVLKSKGLTAEQYRKQKAEKG